MDSIEYGICDMCGREAELSRKYYNYDILCDCHSPMHFELIKHCKDCVPSEPVSTCVHKNGSFMWYRTAALKEMIIHNKAYISDVVFGKIKKEE